MFYSVLAVLIVGPLRDLTACKSQAFKIAGQNIMAAQQSVETSVLFETLHDPDHKTRAVLVFSHIRDMYREVPDEKAWIGFMDSVRSLISCGKSPPIPGSSLFFLPASATPDPDPASNTVCRCMAGNTVHNTVC